MNKFETIELNLAAGKKVYFASDFHLGAGSLGKGVNALEQELVRWLRFVREDAGYLFLVGDIFDYWFEYKYVVPKGFLRLLGELASIADSGISIYYFTGNHDMWMRDYFENELGARMSRNPIQFDFNSEYGTSRFLVGHGDGLGPGDSTYKMLKILFESRLARALFRQLHPDFATRIATAWSGHSRSSNNKKGEDEFKGEDKEWLFQYCRSIEATQHHDYYIFGHRHLMLDMPVGVGSRYLNLGEWFSPGTRYPYGVFDGKSMELKGFRQ